MVYEYVTTKVRFTDQIVKELILHSIEKSHPWPFSRTYGMGTSIPFDSSYLIDSLSDSTIYMAFYTIAHLIGKISSSRLGKDIWDYIFLGKEIDIQDQYIDLLQQMKNEFEYWYPMDLRVSGKDLITNHLTMMFFNHVAIFNDKMIPKSIYVNGHILINNEKMSKNKGNFITLYDAVDKYGADVTRLIASTAGDDINDGNFNDSEVDPSVLAMYAEIQNWQKMDCNSMRIGEYQLIDHIQLIYLTRILHIVKDSYKDMRFRDVVKFGFYEIQSVRNKYENPHKDIYRLLLQAELAMSSPIIPHWAQYLSRKYDIEIAWPKIKLDEQYNNKKMEWLYQYFQIIKTKVTGRIKKLKTNNTHNCIITINNNIKKYLDPIMQYDTSKYDERKKLLQIFNIKKQRQNVIELFTLNDLFIITNRPDQNYPAEK